ncbi:DUF805 domain-containing protein [Campylobacter volucris]|uniref:DUF805 domain-containing protein n=1 Tax=Campylobacter volucris TaxID=1031542 RepID=UPI00189DA0BE|nr:DUF805 domain-containing protein [Campylobacter volucris]MBF7049835.1 DUF805 domain-containing protein [Campylobacter volucris]MBF7060219.1 DUF805 domain-containing protein [Campylobacter volucris]
MNYYLKCIKNYANFNGRARRKEYWMFFLFNAIILLVIRILTIFAPNFFAIIEFLYSLFTFLPSIAVGARRLHDTNRSGWWQLLLLIPLIGIIILIVFYCFKGDSGENRFGSDPLQEVE